MLKRAQQYVTGNQDLVFEVLRIYLGLALFLKGVYFAGHTGEVMSLLDRGGIDVPRVMLAHYVALAHLTGGLMLAAGILTRLAAAVQWPVLLGAVFSVHLREGVFGPSQNLQFATLVLVLLTAYAVAGGGRWSADALLLRQEARLRPRAL